MLIDGSSDNELVLARPPRVSVSSRFLLTREFADLTSTFISLSWIDSRPNLIKKGGKMLL